MRTALITLAACVSLALAAGEETGSAKAPEAPSAVADTLRQAGAKGKEAVVLFRRKEPQGEPMSHAYEASRDKLSDQALFLAVQADDPKEAAAAKRYQIDRLEVPAILVLASDGTLLAGFTEVPDAEKVARVLASRVLPDFQRALAGGGLLLVAVGDPKVEPFQSMLAQANAYAQGAKDKKTILQVDSTDKGEAILLERLAVKETDGAVLCVLNAGRAVGKIPGEVTSEQIEKLVSGGGGGCGSGGCGPGGCK